MFHSGQVFHQSVCPLTVVLLQIFFKLTTVLLSSFLLPFYAPLDVVVHFFVFQLQNVIDQTLKDFFVMQGDWNAKVGKDAWKLARHLWPLQQ